MHRQRNGSVAAYQELAISDEIYLGWVMAVEGRGCPDVGGAARYLRTIVTSGIDADALGTCNARALLGNGLFQ
jgi:hypothetical protein